MTLPVCTIGALLAVARPADCSPRSATEGGFVTITMPITKVDESVTTVAISVAAVGDSTRSVFTLVCPKRFPHGLTVERDPSGASLNAQAFLPACIRFGTSAGLLFANYLAYAYSSQPCSSSTPDTLPIVMFPLSDKPTDLMRQPLRSKVFHDEPEAPGEYFELYINIDTRLRILELSEKDPEYRAAILRSLCVPPRTPLKEP